jgi:hypothetical protein
MLNLDHQPVILKALQNTIIARPPLPPPPPTPKTSNVVPKEQLKQILTRFLAKNSYTISRLTQILSKKNTLF